MLQIVIKIKETSPNCLASSVEPSPLDEGSELEQTAGRIFMKHIHAAIDKIESTARKSSVLNVEGEAAKGYSHIFR